MLDVMGEGGGFQNGEVGSTGILNHETHETHERKTERKPV